MVVEFLFWLAVLFGFFAGIGAFVGLLDRLFPAWDPGEGEW